MPHHAGNVFLRILESCYSDYCVIELVTQVVTLIWLVIFGLVIQENNSKIAYGYLMLHYVRE
jgi:hypothetical protein